MRKYFVHGYRRAFHPQAPAWVDNVPAFRALRDGLNLRQPITLFTGENGVGKSTLLEGIAVSAGFNALGGAYGETITGRENPLRHAATLLRGPRAMNGHFLRAEAHYGVSSQFNLTHDTDLYALSHGESVLRIVQESFHGAGLFLLDEPESGLSFIRQMTLLAELHQIAEAGAQLIIATHSPVLLALPGARIYEFTADGGLLEGIGVEETTSYRALRDFLADPHGIADYMLDVTDA
ncbi:AAA family ATPase [Corynebacterium nasicanis]|uniref:AAA family ATPase n=1 Tax=Corynebacterium nasicanis TaxID=1448267 RepID=A0ABW1QA95_9CORY